MAIKSFRGKTISGSIDTVVLHTNTGSTGYRIKHFQVIGADIFGGSSSELVVKIYSVPQDTATATIDFSDNTLLGVATYSSHDNGHQYPEDQTVIFDNAVFNQDIFITTLCKQGNAGNYYIELEQVKLDLNENTVATLKDIRNIASQWANNIL